MDSVKISKLINEYGNAVYSFCFHLMRNTYDAEELFQDTFLKAIEKSHTIDENNNPKAYLISIAASLAKSRMRKHMRRNAIAPAVSSEEIQITAQIPSVDDSVIKKETRLELNRIISELDDKFRIPILLFYIGEIPLSQAAKILGCPEGTIKSRLHTARNLIKKEMEVRGIGL